MSIFQNQFKQGQIDPNFWKGKHVFLTGHTGFKGGWLSLWLVMMGAKVTGYALAPNTAPNFFNVVGIDRLLEQNHIADIREASFLKDAVEQANPDILIHMAAQPLVRYSYANPVETFETNVMGTVHVLEAARSIKSIKAIVVVTTDKCYENKEWIWGYRENESLGGVDPYSSSKACAELVTSAYRQSFFLGDAVNSSVAIASARAGNVIGGGDWSLDRLIPDALTAFKTRKPLIIRNPKATRPWQHVLEPLSGYLMLVQALFQMGSNFAGAWNFGPRDEGNQTVEAVIDLFSAAWGSNLGWQKDSNAQLHEAHLLKLDCSKAHQELGWVPRWSLPQSIEKIVQWHKALEDGKDMEVISIEQIKQYLSSVLVL